jgi:predicted DNA-binding ribbon-helix-helix protein
MCEYFVKADPIQYEQRSRTVRIRNVLTSLRLENMVWDILAEMAEEEGCTTNALISKFHDEILAHRGEVPNFASFLRVTSMRYLRRCMLALERAQTQAQTPTVPAPALAVISNTNRLQAFEPAPKPLLAVGR